MKLLNKQFLIALLCALIFPLNVFAAIAVGAIWEVRGNGSDTNGGGFVPTITSISSKTDLVINASVPSQVSSSSYGLTSADIGRYIKITAGTGFTIGIYGPISAVTSGTATLDRAAGTVSSTGGSFTIYSGIDYTQKNAANSSGGNISTTDLVTNGTTTVTSATASFTKDIIGNVVYISGGTGSITAGRYEVTAETNSTTITLDRATGLTSGTGATFNVGGGVADLAEAFSARGIAGGNKIWWKNDVALTSSTALTGPTDFGISIFGYNNTRGDITTTLGLNRPMFTFTGTGACALTLVGGAGVVTQNLQNFIINANGGAGNSGICFSAATNYPNLYNITVENYASVGINLANASNVIVLDSEVKGGTSTATAGIVDNGRFSQIFGSYVHDGFGIGISSSSQQGAQVIGNVVANMAGATSDCINFGAGPALGVVINNIAYNCGRDGINATAANYSGLILQNVLDSNGAFGINSAPPTQQPFIDGNAFYNNTSGALGTVSNATVVPPVYSFVNNINLTADPFVSASTGNFSLNNTAGGGALLVNTGIPRAWTGNSATASYPYMGPAVAVCPTPSTIYANCSY